MLGALGTLPQDGCHSRLAAMFQQQRQVNEGFVVIRLQIQRAAKTVFGLRRVSRRLTNQPQEDIGLCTGAVHAHGRLAQRVSDLQLALIGEPPGGVESGRLGISWARQLSRHRTGRCGAGRPLAWV